jgi:hypothetical protein
VKLEHEADGSLNAGDVSSGIDMKAKINETPYVSTNAIERQMPHMGTDVTPLLTTPPILQHDFHEIALKKTTRSHNCFALWAEHHDEIPSITEQPCVEEVLGPTIMS